METSAFEKRALARLKAHGYRITMPRVQVIRALAETSQAMTAYRIHEAIVGAGGRIDVVSVYRIIDTLLEIGLIYKLGSVEGYFRRESYSLNGFGSLVINVDTGEVAELTMDTSVTEPFRVEAARLGCELLGCQVEIRVGQAKAAPRSEVA